MRVSDWETRLAEYLAVAHVRAEAGRENFCALFAAGAVKAVTGDDPAAPFRGKYRAVAKRLEATIDGLFPDVPVALAQRGDLAWRDGSVGVVIGGEALFVTEGALMRVPRGQWDRAWAVGRG